MLPVSMREWLGVGLSVLSMVSAMPLQAHAESPLASIGSTQIIQVSPDLRPSLTAMLETSETFRQQYQRILDTPRLVLTARIDARMFEHTFRARSSIRRYNSGLMIIVIEIGPASDPVEMIAHEFEHVLEQLDGVDLHRRALRGRGAWYSHGFMIETERAVRAGRAVKRELRQIPR